MLTTLPISPRVVKAVYKIKRDLKIHFDTKEEGPMEEYVGCKIKKADEDTLLMYQDDLLNKIERDFRDYLKDFQNYDISAATNDHLKRPNDNNNLITKKNQTKYS